MTQSLVGKGQAGQDQEDLLLSALTNLAYADKPDLGEPQRRSRFWFQLQTTDQYVDKKKKALKTKPIEHIDAEVRRV
jgi:hypothetical protein